MLDQDELEGFITQAKVQQTKAKDALGHVAQRHYQQATTLYEKAAMVMEKEYGKYDEETLMVRDWWAVNLREAGDLNPAIKCNLENLERYRGCQKPEKTAIIDVQRRLAECYAASRQHLEAVEIYQSVVDAAGQQLSLKSCQDRIDLATATYDLGVKQGTTRGIKKAAALNAATLSQAIQHLGKDHILAIKVRYNLGRELLELQKHDEALTQLKENVKICETGTEAAHIRYLDRSKTLMMVCSATIAEMKEKKRLEKERLEKERLEKERLEKERLEKERLEKERLEKERLEKERLEKERLERKKLEKERLEKKKLEKERLEKERLEKERLEKKRLKRERVENEKMEREKLEEEKRLEMERLTQQMLREEGLKNERLKNKRIKQEPVEKKTAEERKRLEAERLARQKLRQERLAKEELASEMLEKERIKKERLKKEQLEKERFANERSRKERLENERLGNERLENERLENEGSEARRSEAERIKSEQKKAVKKERPKSEHIKKEECGKKGIAEEAVAAVATTGAKEPAEYIPCVGMPAEGHPCPIPAAMDRPKSEKYDQDPTSPQVVAEQKSVSSPSRNVALPLLSSRELSSSEQRPQTEENKEIRPTLESNDSQPRKIIPGALTGPIPMLETPRTGFDHTEKLNIHRTSEYQPLSLPSQLVSRIRQCDKKGKVNVPAPLPSSQGSDMSHVMACSVEQAPPIAIVRTDTSGSNRTERIIPGGWSRDFDDPVHERKSGRIHASDDISTGKLSAPKSHSLHSRRASSVEPLRPAKPLRKIQSYLSVADQEGQKSDEWFDDMSRDVHGLLDYNDCSFIGNPPKKVKIAILDTGVAKKPGTGMVPPQMKSPRIRCGKQLDRSLPWNIDVNGHGTHAAGLILTVCPYADLYVYRVVEDQEEISKAYVREALVDAIDVKGVDIVSMSLGWEEDSDPGLRAVIERAKTKNVLLFAASSNDGISTAAGMAYPARALEVIAIDAADGYGNASKFNPPQKRDKARFTALGEAVRSSYPMQLSEPDDEPGWKRMSGTSCATPIAAAIAACVLVFARQRPLCLEPSVESYLKSVVGMRAVFMDLLSTKHSDSSFFHHLVPTKLFNCTRQAPDGGEWCDASSSRYQAAMDIVRCLRKEFDGNIGRDMYAEIAKEWGRRYRG